MNDKRDKIFASKAVVEASKNLSGEVLKCPACNTPVVPSLSGYADMKGVFIPTITCPTCYTEWLNEQTKDS